MIKPINKAVTLTPIKIPVNNIGTKKFNVWDTFGEIQPHNSSINLFSKSINVSLK